MWFKYEQPFLSGERCVTSRKAAANAVKRSIYVSQIIVNPFTLRSICKHLQMILLSVEFPFFFVAREIGHDSIFVGQIRIPFVWL